MLIAIRRNALPLTLLAAACSMTVYAEPVPMNSPAESSIPQGPVGDAIKLGSGNTLNDQDAMDIAAYLTHQPRSAFAGAKNDYANGNKPKDARN